MKTSFLILATLFLALRTWAAPPDVSGKWKWIYDRDGESLNIELNLEQKGSKLTGKINAPEGRQMEIQEGRIADDGTIDFYTNLERDSGPLKISFAGKADGDSIKGKTIYASDGGEKRERDWTPKREASLSGKWDSSFKRSDGTAMETTLTLKQEGEKLTGTQAFNENETEIRDGKVEAGQITFRILRERDGRTVTSKYRGKLQKDNTIKGEIESDWTGEVRKLEWEARKAKAK